MLKKYYMSNEIVNFISENGNSIKEIKIDEFKNDFNKKQIRVWFKDSENILDFFDIVEKDPSDDLGFRFGMYITQYMPNDVVVYYSYNG